MKTDIWQLQPSDIILSERKLAKSRFVYDNGLYRQNIIIAPLDQGFAIVDGNHSAYAAYEQGLVNIKSYIENREIENIPSIISRGITKISDLSDRIVSHEEWMRKSLHSSNFEDELSDDEFFDQYPEIEIFCSYR